MTNPPQIVLDIVTSVQDKECDSSKYEGLNPIAWIETDDLWGCASCLTLCSAKIYINLLTKCKRVIKFKSQRLQGSSNDLRQARAAQGADDSTD
jgi:NAD-dependent dihydropyrimidine dehydrogenase PreA subunit